MSFFFRMHVRLDISIKFTTFIGVTIWSKVPYVCKPLPSTPDFRSNIKDQLAMNNI